MPRGRNDYETAQIQQRLWTPQLLRPKSWHDAADISTITISGSGVSEWRDKSGNGISLTQATDSQRPTLINAAYSPYNAVKFTNTGTTVGQQLTGAAPFSSGSEFTIISALLTPASATTNYSWHWTFANDASRISLAGPYQTTVAYYADLNGFAGSNRISGNGPAHNTWNIFNLVNTVSGSLKELYANGSSTAFASASSGSSGTFSTFKLGNGPDNTYCGIAMAEILTFDVMLSSRSVKATEGYLSWKWGIPLAANHPFANRPPLIGD